MCFRAKCWGEAFIPIFQSVQAFDRAFLSSFWDATKQLHIRLKIEGGRFEKGPYVEHFTKFVAMARHFQPPITEPMLIGLIARHFPPTIATTLVGVIVFSDAISRSQQADYYNRTGDSGGSFRGGVNKFTDHKKYPH